MGQNLIENLNKGLFLEKSKELIPWKIPFDNLTKFGYCEIKEVSDQRTDLVWNNETILNGLSVNPTIMRWTQLFKTYKFAHAFSYLSDKEFEDAKEKLNLELQQKGKFKKLNQFEYKYTWRLKQCTVELTKRDRFGSYYIIDIRHKRKIWFWN